MELRDTYEYLASNFDQSTDRVDLSEADIEILNYTFHSQNRDVLPGAGTYYCEKHELTFSEEFAPHNGTSEAYYEAGLYKADYQIEQNYRFRYSIFRPSGHSKNDGVILLLHGLNEKYWTKYLPWASHLVRTTGKAVILFPLAFHMNRAPSEWSNPRLMRSISDYRKTNLSPINRCTFANSAISARLQMIPQRFFWSGLQTYRDLIQLARLIREGSFPYISADARLDLCTYSIGSFLAEILMMVNPEKLYDNSRLFIFCGGPTMDGMNPVSKYILDSRAQIALYSFYIQHLDTIFKEDHRLAHYFSEQHNTGKHFRIMLNQHLHKKPREERLHQLSNQIKAIALEKDEVVPPIEVLNTLQGPYRNIPIDVEVMDFPYSYNHVNPFPLTSPDPQDLNRSFNTVFDKAASFFTN